MNLSLIILAFYIVLLSCFPCQDAPVRIANRISSDIGLTHDDTHHKDLAVDFCSPFCTCSCCATVNIPPVMFGYSLPVPVPTSPEKSFEYKASFQQGNVGLIWQPPLLM